MNVYEAEILVPLADWGVRIRTRNPTFHAWLKNYLRFDAVADGRSDPAKEVILSINSAIGTPPAGGTDFDAPKLGFTRRIWHQDNYIEVFVEPTEYCTPNYVFHIGVLLPVSYFLRAHGLTLAHAGLVAKHGEGILIVGQARAGKSSLSLALAQAGYTFYSDEHPVLGSDDRGAIGSCFFGTPALLPRSAERLGTFGLKTQWSDFRQKFCVDLSSFPLPGRQETCAIRKILFPQYDANRSWELSPLNSRRAFEALCKDEYLTVCGRGDEEKPRHRFHVNFLLSLATSAQGYVLRYNLDGIEKLGNGKASI